MRVRIIGICPTCDSDNFSKTQGENNELLFECHNCEDRIPLDDMKLELFDKRFMADADNKLVLKKHDYRSRLEKSLSNLNLRSE